MKKDTPDDAGYEVRFVCFLDILGFAAQVQQSTTDVAHYHKIRSSFELVADVSRDAAQLGVRIFAFSDSIVISSKADFESLTVLLEFVESLHQELWQQGMLLRGGFTFGSLKHEDEYVFGPALVEAYLLESRTARLPRTIVSVAAHHQCLAVAGSEEQRTYVAERIGLDSDGCIFLKVIGGLEQFFNSLDRDEKELGLGICRNIASEMGKNLRQSLNKPDIWEKHVWFATQYNDFVSTVSIFAPGQIPMIDEFGVALRAHRPDTLPVLRTPRSKK